MIIVIVLVSFFIIALKFAMITRTPGLVSKTWQKFLFSYLIFRVRGEKRFSHDFCGIIYDSRLRLEFICNEEKRIVMQILRI